MNIPLQILLTTSLGTFDAGITFSLTPEVQKHLSLLRKHDSVWLVDYPFIQFFEAGNFRIIRVYDSSDRNTATQSKLFYFEMSAHPSAPVQIEPSSVVGSGNALLYGGRTFKPLFEWAFPKKESIQSAP